jgi:hypothetical protein
VKGEEDQLAVERLVSSIPAALRGRMKWLTMSPFWATEDGGKHLGSLETQRRKGRRLYHSLRANSAATDVLCGVNTFWAFVLNLEGQIDRLICSKTMDWCGVKK